ncbi:MAG: hypothetical protein R3A44_19485 [Caldilineaceae bacterium]
MLSRSKLLTESFTVKGFWWLPGHENHNVPGEVSFEPYNAINLTIQGSFAPEESRTRRLYNHHVILGLTDDNQPCTLIENSHLSSNRNFTRTTSEVYSTHYMFIGEHFEIFDDIRFVHCDVWYSRLEEWLWLQPFIQQRCTSSDSDKAFLTVTFDFPEVIKTDIVEKEISVEIRHGLHHESSAKTELLEYHSHFRFMALDTAQGVFQWYRNHIYDVQDFLSLLMNEPSFFRKVVGRLMSNSEQKRDIEIFFVQPLLENYQDPHFSNILIQYRDITDKFPLMLSKWLSNHEDFKPLQDLFFGYFNHPDVHVNFGFLSLMQALESYHRTTMPGTYVTSDKYEEHRKVMVESLPADLPSDLRDALKARLKYGNEFSLRKRLGQIFDILNPRLRKLICKDHREFISQIVGDRNYLTHYDQESKPEGFSAQRLYYSTQQLITLLVILLLKDLSLDDDMIYKAVKENRKLWPWH